VNLVGITLKRAIHINYHKNCRVQIYVCLPENPTNYSYPAYLPHNIHSLKTDFDYISILSLPE